MYQFNEDIFEESFLKLLEAEDNDGELEPEEDTDENESDEDENDNSDDGELEPEEDTDGEDNDGELEPEEDTSDDDDGEVEANSEPPKDVKAEEFMKLQIYNKLEDLKKVSIKFLTIITQQNMNSFSIEEKNIMSEITEKTTKDLNTLKEKIVLFNNNYINNTEIDKSKLIYKEFKKVYKSIFDDYLKQYNKLSKK